MKSEKVYKKYESHVQSVILIICFFCNLSSFAGPADTNLIRTIELADGSVITVRLVGDEYGHYWQSVDDGTCYTEDRNGGFVIADSHQMVAASRMRKEAAKVRMNKTLTSQGYPCTTLNLKGTVHIPVVMIEFSDVSFQPEHKPALIHRIFNETGFSERPEFKGSVRDYFVAQSNGAFVPVFDVFGPVRLPRTLAYYGHDVNGNFSGKESEIVIEAINALDGQVDFSMFDWNGDGAVETIIAICAGAEQATTGKSDDIWSHASAFKAFSNDAVHFTSYACTSELREISHVLKLNGIGTICHELSHCFGLPDTYSVNSNTYGTQRWDLMGQGVHLNNGYTPAGYTAFDKMFCKWQDPVVLRENTEVTNMQPMSEGGNFYLIPNDGDHCEFFTLENRQKTGWDSYLPANGMLIMHVDYDEDFFSRYNPNRTDVEDNDHERMALVLADNDPNINYNDYKEFIEDFQGDLYPFKGNNSLTNTTTPRAVLYRENIDGRYLLSKPVTGIAQNGDGTMRFRFENSLLSCERYSLSMSDPTFRFSSAEGIWCKVSVRNDSYLSYDRGLAAMIYRKGNRNQVVKKVEISVSISPGETAEYEFEVSGLASAEDYELMVCYHQDRVSEKWTAGTTPYEFSMQDVDKYKMFVDDAYTMEVLTANSARLTVNVNNDSYLPYKRLIAAYSYLNDENGKYVIQPPRAFWSGEVPAYGSASVSFTLDGFEIDKLYHIFLWYYESQDAKNWTQMGYAYLVKFDGSTPHPTHAGDVNGDGKVDIVDVTSTISHILGLLIEDFSAEAADVNGDSKVDIVDVTAIIDIILKHH